MPRAVDQQAMQELEQSGGDMSSMSMREMLMNIAQFRQQALAAYQGGDEDADLREALSRSVAESEGKPALPPPASAKAIASLRSNNYSRAVRLPPPSLSRIPLETSVGGTRSHPKLPHEARAASPAGQKAVRA